MNRLLTFAGCIAAALALLCSSAAADEGPPEDFEETCTVEKQQVPGLQCVECSASYEDPETCATQHSGQGLTKACRSYGASFWKEVWCKGEPTGEPAADPSGTATPPAEDKKGGGCGIGDAATGAWWVFFAALGLLVLITARRRSYARAA